MRSLVISRKIDIILTSLFVLIIVIIGWPRYHEKPKIVIHKVINYNQYNIVINSKANKGVLFGDRTLYADVWQNSKQTDSFRICKIGVVHEYYGTIKDIIFISDTDELKIEYMYPAISESGTGVDIYKLSKAPENSTADQLPGYNQQQVVQ
jgi:hypothetical protein